MAKLLPKEVNVWHFNKKDEGGILEKKNSGIVHTGARSAPDIAVHDRVYDRGQHRLRLRITRESTGRKGVATREATPRTCIGVTDAGPPYGGLDQAGTTLYLGDKESIYMSSHGFPCRDGEKVEKMNFHGNLVEHPDEILIYVDMENRIVGFTGKANTSMGVKWADRKDVHLPSGVQALRLCLRLWHPDTHVQLVSIEECESGDGGGNSESDTRSNGGGDEGEGDCACQNGSDDSNAASSCGGSVAVVRSGKRKRTSVTEEVEFDITPGQEEISFEVPRGAKRGKAVLTFTF